MTDHPNLATALAAFQGEMPTVSKTRRAEVPTKSGGRYSYTYADLAGITEAAMPILSSHGLSFATRPRFTPEGYELQGVLLHTSGEKLTGTLPIRGNTPQEIGSSLTYMRRYLFGCLSGVVTEDDDDAQAAEKGSRKAQDEPQAPAGTTRRMARPRPAQTDGGAATPVTAPPSPSAKQRAAMFALFTEAAGFTTDPTTPEGRKARLDYISYAVGREVTSSGELTAAEVSKVIDHLKADATERPADSDEPPLWPEPDQP